MSNKINLPDLNEYRNEFINKGIDLPLSTVPYSEKGLLKELPKVPINKTGWPWTKESKIGNEKCGKPKITIVMPSYNQGEFLEETIRSVLLQNYPNLEFIVIDGGSSDNSKEVLENYSHWLSYWQSEKDNGQGHAINLGFSLASGNLFGWINSDDYYLAGCFELVSNTFLYNSIEFIYGDYLKINFNNKIDYIKSKLVLDRYLRFGGIIPSHSVFWRNSIHQPIWEELNCAVDAELWLRLIPNKKRKFLHYPLSVFRKHKNAKTGNLKYKQMWKDDYENKIWKVYPEVKNWRYLTYEFKLVQWAYKFLNRRKSKITILDKYFE